MEEVEKSRNRQYYMIVSASFGCDYTNDNQLYIFQKYEFSVSVQGGNREISVDKLFSTSH